MSRRVGESKSRGVEEEIPVVLLNVLMSFLWKSFPRRREPIQGMPAFLENWMGPCLRRDDLLKKQTLHQHIEEHYQKYVLLLPNQQN